MERNITIFTWLVFVAGGGVLGADFFGECPVLGMSSVPWDEYLEEKTKKGRVGRGAWDDMGVERNARRSTKSVGKVEGKISGSVDKHGKTELHTAVSPCIGDECDARCITVVAGTGIKRGSMLYV